LDFDGSNDRLTAFGNDSTNNIGLTHLYTTDSSYSFFAIAIADTVSTNSNNTYENRAMWGDAAGYTGFYFRSNNTAGVYNYVTAYQTATVSYTAGSLALFGAEHSGGSLRVRLNAGSETSTSAGAMNILARVQNFQFGRQWNADSYCLDGKIGEIIFYNRAVSSVQRQAIEGYLAHKWGLSSSLPATHPYKNVVP
jgi:hypothetical protein